jgi:hypothetical protein
VSARRGEDLRLFRIIAGGRETFDTQKLRDEQVAVIYTHVIYIADGAATGSDLRDDIAFALETGAVPVATRQPGWTARDDESGRRIYAGFGHGCCLADPKGTDKHRRK